MTRTNAVVWIFDRGAEDKFPVSLSTLRLNAPDVWKNYVKIIIDVGMSDAMRHWIASMARENVFLATLELSSAEEAIGGKHNRPAQIMLARLMLCQVISDLMRLNRIPLIDSFLHVDTDTAFFDSPAAVVEMNWIGEHLRAVKEWDWIGDPALNLQQSLRLDRSSTFVVHNARNEERLARHLGVDVGEFRTIETYNSGVWVARTESPLSVIWREAYEQLRLLDQSEGGNFLAPYSAEENALSVGIYFGKLLCRPLPRRFNQFPPRPPHAWPEDTVIGHFITFHRNGHEDRYQKWFDFRRLILQKGLCPEVLMCSEHDSIPLNSRPGK